jgi:hypothetical protein
MRHLIIIVLLACVISTHSAGRMVYVPSPTRALDKAAFERFVNNPDDWISLTLAMDYFDTAGLEHSVTLTAGDEGQRKGQSVHYEILYNFVEGNAIAASLRSGRGWEAFVYDTMTAELPDREIALSFLRSEAVRNLFTREPPCSVCQKGWITSSHGELYKKGNEYFTLHIGFLSKERGSVEVEGHRVGGYIYYGGPTFMTDFPEPKNEEEKKALQGVREIIKYAKEKFIDYGMKNYWCKKEYRGGKVVSAVTGNQPVPKGKECKPNR